MTTHNYNQLVVAINDKVRFDFTEDNVEHEIMGIFARTPSSMSVIYPPSGETIYLTCTDDDASERLKAFVKRCRDGQRLDELADMIAIGRPWEPRDELAERLSPFVSHSDNAEKACDEIAKWLREQKQI